MAIEKRFPWLEENQCGERTITRIRNLFSAYHSRFARLRLNAMPS
jgi:hypothetical protein